MSETWTADLAQITLDLITAADADCAALVRVLRSDLAPGDVCATVLE